MRYLLVALLLLLLLLVVPVTQAAPKAGGHRPEATKLDPDPDPLSPELAMLQLLWSAVKSLGLLEQDVGAMTREQALLYLFVLHDHDRSGHLDGLELLQLLSLVLAQQDGERPDPEMVAALVDRALERQDRSRDGLLNPSELLLSPHQSQGTPGQPLHGKPPGELLPGAGTVPREDVEMSSPGHGPAEGQVSPQVEAPDTEAVEVKEAPEAKDPNTEAIKAEEDSEMRAPEGETAPVWGDPEEG